MFIAYCDEAHRWFTNRNITPFGPTVEREKASTVTDTTTTTDTIEENATVTADDTDSANDSPPIEPSPLMPPALLSDLAVKGHCMTQV